MPFTLSPMTEDDIPAFALVDERAMADYNLAKAMQVPDVPRRVFAEEWTRKDWGKDPNKHWLKAVDSETGDLAAAALWTFEFKPDKANADEEVPAPVEGEGADNKVEEAKEKQISTTTSIFAWMRQAWVDFKAEFIGDKPFANLNILVTDPKYQRKGAGSMLIKWGCDKADEHGLMTILQASLAGLKLYEAHGFEIVKIEEKDLSPWGVNETTIRRGMIRRPRSNVE